MTEKQVENMEHWFCNGGPPEALSKWRSLQSEFYTDISGEPLAKMMDRKGAILQLMDRAWKDAKTHPDAIWFNIPKKGEKQRVLKYSQLQKVG